ncbi:aminotransferase class V-fold PLP-dependent enzyme [Elioraea tepidiphila]|uniref:aminotransferase class V-fold PLP-dependent enzyme n=1 Tax=Elioraea tepidiphila TaxID=457934 RepID=UPI00037698A5|nr:aminotransferase class V-fold PLP-dependent enzyme [Elioraea tepidiphila]
MSAPAVPLFDPAAFRIGPGIAHLCAGGETPFLLRHDEALRRYAVDKSNGEAGRHAQEAEVERARALAAALWGVAVEDIGFVSSVAEGVSMLIESIDWRPGDNAVFDANEYPSVIAPLLVAGAAEVRLASAERPMASLVDGRTRLIGASHVSYLHGARADLPALRALADRVGALLVVDHTQAAGAMPIAAAIADFAFAATYKWLLGMTGVAVAYWNRARQPGWAPRTAGWHSLGGTARPRWDQVPALRPDAMRFCRGNPAHGPVYVLAGALDYLRDFDPSAVQRHIQGCTTALLAGLAELGIASTTPADPAHHGASVCFESPNAEEITARLAERGVLVWNGRGRVRISVHGYNALSDVEACLAALRSLRPLV